MRKTAQFFRIAGVLAVCLAGVLVLAAEVSQVRLPLFRGFWYPATAEALRAACEQYINEAQLPMPVRGRVLACVAPNAGYPNAGSVAAHAFKPLETGQYDRVIVLTASHSARFSGCSIPAVQYYATPLGLVSLDGSACKRAAWSALIETRTVLYRDVGISSDKRVAIHEAEHGIEILLPFLQVQLGNFELVPIVVGDLLDTNGRIRSSAVKSIAGVLERIVDERTLIVVSSNLTYYGERYRYTPFKENEAEGIEWLDKQALHYALNRDLDGFLDYIEKTRNPIDGAAPLAILIALLPDRVEGYLLNYQTSAQEMGEGGSSVSYAALVFSDPAVPPNEAGQIVEVQPWEPADTSDISLYDPTKPITGKDTAGRLSNEAEAGVGE
ncbi:MAG: AmmeMemoRadiSam system protein B [Candidatus Hydrogenedentes bacterium]|nr:AmmeMemoRadiSam system protein B [Candidatus Hydrogenedentota bacterium]